MIYFSETPLKMWQPNLIMLDLEDDMGHIYVTRNTYDQAVLISDRFNHDADLVTQKLGCANNQEDVTSFMVATLPTPISILTPFYNLIDKNVKLDVENLKQVIGVLSYLSMNLDFNMMLKVPFEVRANLVFTKSILLDYQGHFEDFNFKISESNGHILSDRTSVSSQGDNRSRADREDFELEPKREEEKGFDEAAFFADLGWDDMEIPKLNLDPTPVESTSTPTVISTPTPASVSEASLYEDIASKYV